MLNTKYDVISLRMGQILEELVKERKASDKRIKKLIDAVIQNKTKKSK